MLFEDQFIKNCKSDFSLFNDMSLLFNFRENKRQEVEGALIFSI
jgi:hypothetical protein